MHALVCPLCRIALPPVEDVCPRDGHTGKEVSWLPAPYALSQRFNVLEPFAHGDTGSLYIADESETGRRGLLKILAPVPSEQLAERQRLRRELVKQATLARTNLLLPLASGESDGSAWIFRDWLDGVSLEVRLSREGALRQTEALAIAAQIASALDELHRGGVLHRDVKPGHIFLQPTPHGIPRAMLIDVGLAASFANLRGAPLYGTPGYVAPEQLLGKLVSFRSDLYSLGCVLYRMLTGRPAFSGETLEQVLTAQRQGELPPLPSGLPHGIGALLQSILAKEPQDRPFSAQKLRRTLDPFLPDGALMEKQTTATFETVPKPTPSAAPQASGTLRPPPPPPARPSRPPKSTTPASARDERTHQLDLDQIEEFLPPSRRPTSSPPPVPGAKSSSRPPASPAAPIPSEKTQPIRLDQILGISAAGKGSSTPPPRTFHEQPADKPLSPAAAGSLFAAAALEPSEPAPTKAAPVESAAAKLASPPEPVRPASPDPAPAALAASSVERSAGEAETGEQPARTPMKATLVGMAGLGPAPVEPSAPAVEAAPVAPAMAPAAVVSERDHPTERIPTTRVEPGSPSATESITGRGLAVLAGHGDPRRLLMYASAAVVGLAVLGVGASALLSDPEPEPAVQNAHYAAPPPLPAAAVAEPTPSAQPVAPTPRPVVEPIAAAPATKAKPSEPTTAPEPPATKEPAAVERPSEPRSAASTARAEKRDQAREERRAREKLQAESKSSERAGPRSGSSGADAFAAARDEARAHYAAKRFKEAAAAYERAAKADPKNAGTYAGLGAARLQLGDAKAALKAYQQAAQLSPQTPGFQTALGRTYLALGDKSRAIAAYKKALALDPKNEAAKTALRELGG